MDRFPDRIETDRILCFPFCSQLCSCKWKGKTDGLCWLISNCLAGSTLHPLCLTLQAGCPGRMTAEDHGRVLFGYLMVQPPGGIRRSLKGRRSEGRVFLPHSLPTRAPAAIMFLSPWWTSHFMTTFLLGFDNTSTSSQVLQTSRWYPFLLLITPRALTSLTGSLNPAHISVCGPFIKLSSLKPIYFSGQEMNSLFLKQLLLGYK